MNSVFLLLTVSLLADSHLWTFSISLLKLISVSWALCPLRVILVSSANNVALVNSKQFGRSLMYKRNKMEPSLEPRGTPHLISLADDILPFIIYLQSLYNQLNVLSSLILQKDNFKIYTCTIYNMSGRVVSDLQARAEGERLYIWCNTDANVVKVLKNERYYLFICEVIFKINVV